jgi:hypothetical protein
MQLRLSGFSCFSSSSDFYLFCFLWGNLINVSLLLDDWLNSFPLNTFLVTTTILIDQNFCDIWEITEMIQTPVTVTVLTLKWGTLFFFLNFLNQISYVIISFQISEVLIICSYLQNYFFLVAVSPSSKSVVSEFFKANSFFFFVFLQPFHFINLCITPSQ